MYLDNALFTYLSLSKQYTTIVRSKTKNIVFLIITQRWKKIFFNILLKIVIQGMLHYCVTTICFICKSIITTLFYRHTGKTSSNISTGGMYQHLTRQHKGVFWKIRSRNLKCALFFVAVKDVNDWRHWPLSCFNIKAFIDVDSHTR